MTKRQNYAGLLRDLRSVIGDVEESAAGVLANAAALIYERTGALWAGFYMVDDGMLKLGPFQGPVACYRIAFGRGVCGAAWQRAATVVVPDVEAFAGHIACSSLSQSEIVVPIFGAAGDVVGVLDVDSRRIAAFDVTDRYYLEQACEIIAAALRRSPYRA